jgi:hypothetical protein
MSTKADWVVQRLWTRDPNADMGRTDLIAEGTVIELITPDELNEIEPGTVLYDIFGFPATVGVDEFDTDTRGGYLAYGFVKS